MPHHEVGEVVRIVDDIAEAYRLQKDHGGWNDDMALVRILHTCIYTEESLWIGLATVHSL